MYLLIIFVLSSFFIGYGIIPSLTKGIAAQYPPHGQPKTDEKSAFSECLYRIFRAGWSETAAGTFKRRNVPSVKPYKAYCNMLHCAVIPSFLNAAERSRSISVDFAFTIFPLATITTRNPRFIFALLSERR